MVKMRPTRNDDLQLLEVALAILQKRDDSVENVGFWSRIHSGVFVTGYLENLRSKKSRHQGDSGHQGDSRHGRVWCCMSNGDYQGYQTVLTNVRASARLCASDDPRRIQAIRPDEAEITVLAPRSRWRKDSDIHRERNFTIAVESNQHQAFFLPTVWNDNPQWKPGDLLRALTKKAGISGIVRIYQIPCYEINRQESRDWEYFQDVTLGVLPAGVAFGSNPAGVAFGSNPTGLWNSLTRENFREILKGGWEFYHNFASGFELAYLVVPDTTDHDHRSQKDPDRSESSDHQESDEQWKVSYGGPPARVCYDYLIFWNLAQHLGQDVTPYIATGLAIDPGDNLVDVVAYWDLFLQTRGGDSRDMIGMLLEIKQDRCYICDDLAFGNPQVELFLAKYGTPLLDKPHELKEYLDLYEPQVDRLLEEYGGFGANWIAQGLAALVTPTTRFQLRWRAVDLGQKLLERCYRALRGQDIERDSITLQACGLRGILALAEFLGTKVIPVVEVQDIIQQWLTWQKEFGTGGFRYYPEQEWYRTDVTSHVVEVILRLQEL